MAGLVPCQVRFVEAQKKDLNWRRSVHLGGWFAGGLLVRLILQQSDALVEFLEASVILEAEILALLMAVRSLTLIALTRLSLKAILTLPCLCR